MAPSRPLPSFSFALAAIPIPISYRYTIPKTSEDSNSSPPPAFPAPAPAPIDAMTTVDINVDSESVDKFDYCKLCMPYLFEDDDEEELDFCVGCSITVNRVKSNKKFWLLRLMIFIRKLVGKNHTSSL